ncbi:MAG: polysaccharide deacetylase family protein [Streptosporangiaceae bacterium]
MKSVVKILTAAILAVTLGVLLAEGSGGATTPAPISAHTPTALPAQIPVLVYHGIGTPSSVVGSVANYNVTLANFQADMKTLAAAGYATITPAQYAAWLNGTNSNLPAKPILITFDDAFTSDTQATSVLARYGFHAVMFVVTGYADGAYNGIDNSGYAPWSTVAAMAGQGWYLQLHAGLCGHAYLPYAPASCLAGLDTAVMDASHFQYYVWDFGQTDSAYEARVEADITNGEADLASHAGFPAGWQSTLFAVPFSAWTNGQNPWLDGYWASLFGASFVQQIPSAAEGAAKKYRIRFRLELGYGARSASYLMSHLNNAAFTRAGATGTVNNAPTLGSGG